MVCSLIRGTKLPAFLVVLLLTIGEPRIFVNYYSAVGALRSNAGLRKLSVRPRAIPSRLLVTLLPPITYLAEVSKSSRSFATSGNPRLLPAKECYLVFQVFPLSTVRSLFWPPQRPDCRSSPVPPRELPRDGPYSGLAEWRGTRDFKCYTSTRQGNVEDCKGENSGLESRPQLKEQPPFPMQQLSEPQPAAGELLDFVLTAKVDSCFCRFCVWHLGHSGFCSPNKMASN
jgi:hypothetical protein